MKKTIITALIILMGTLSLFSQSSGLRFDGMYQSETEEYSYFLRFYPDNTVISVTSDGEAAVIAEWFKKPFYDTGTYELKGKKISFECTSEDGTVVYKGVIKTDVLVLKSESLINGYKSKKTYTFVKI